MGLRGKPLTFYSYTDLQICCRANQGFQYLICFLHNFRYLNDFYVLDMKPQGTGSGMYLTWTVPEVSGEPPSVRESHTANMYTPPEDPDTSYMIIFGGMNGTRLGDLHMLKISKW